MLFLNFLDTDNIAPKNGFMGVVANTGTYTERLEQNLPLEVEVSMRATGFGSLDLEKGEFIEGPGKNTLLIYEGYEGWSDESPRSIFFCDEDRAATINKCKRNASEDTIIAVEKIRFFRGIPAYYSFMPLGKGMLICVYGGAIQVYVNGDWILYNVIKGGVDELHTPTYEYDCAKLMEMVTAYDKKSKYDMAKDGVILVETLIDVKKGELNVKFKSNKEYFQLLNEENVIRARFEERLRKKREEEARAKKVEENRIAMEQLREREIEKQKDKEKKAAGKKKSTRKPKSSEEDKVTEVSESDGAMLFKNLLNQSGYKR